MLQKAYWYGGIFLPQQKKTRGIIWKSYRKAKSWRNANIYINKNQDGKRYSKPRKVLWRNESFVSAQYIKTGLQLENFEGEKGRKSLKSLIVKEKRIFIKYEVLKSEETIWKRRPKVQITQ